MLWKAYLAAVFRGSIVAGNSFLEILECRRQSEKSLGKLCTSWKRTHQRSPPASQYYPGMSAGLVLTIKWDGRWSVSFTAGHTTTLCKIQGDALTGAPAEDCSHLIIIYQHLSLCINLQHGVICWRGVLNRIRIDGRESLFVVKWVHIKHKQGIPIINFLPIVSET